MPFPILVALIRCHIDDRLDGWASTDGIEKINRSNHVGGKGVDGGLIGFANQWLRCQMIDDVWLSLPKKCFDSVRVTNIKELDIERVMQIRLTSKDRTGRLEAKTGNACP